MREEKEAKQENLFTGSWGGGLWLMSYDRGTAARRRVGDYVRENNNKLLKIICQIFLH